MKIARNDYSENRFITLKFNDRIEYTPSLQKSLGLQSQGGKGAAVGIYCKPLPTQDLKS